MDWDRSLGQRLLRRVVEVPEAEEEEGPTSDLVRAWDAARDALRVQLPGALYGTWVACVPLGKVEAEQDVPGGRWIGRPANASVVEAWQRAGVCDILAGELGARLGSRVIVALE